MPVENGGEKGALENGSAPRDFDAPTDEHSRAAEPKSHPGSWRDGLALWRHGIDRGTHAEADEDSQDAKEKATASDTDADADNANATPMAAIVPVASAAEGNAQKAKAAADEGTTEVKADASGVKAGKETNASTEAPKFAAKILQAAAGDHPAQPDRDTAVRMTSGDTDGQRLEAKAATSPGAAQAQAEPRAQDTPRRASRSTLSLPREIG